MGLSGEFVNRLNHEGHKGHKGHKGQPLHSWAVLRALRVLRGSIRLSLLALAPIMAAKAQTKPRTGLVITRSTRMTPGTYRLAAPTSLDSAAITIRGDDITLDLRGVTLNGTAPNADPDEGAGVAIRIEGGRNVRVIGARIRGYKVAIMARGTRQLTLERNDVSRNWKPRLFSVVEHESLADWLSYHHNEQDEWLRFGAAIYLADVKTGAITGNTAEQGMNGLLLVRSDSLDIRANNVSFNSGLGIGMYRASYNTIVSNRVDYNVRGYSHGFFYRGQDSADLLMFEQCLHNVVAYNSMTHGGDGLFIWAGQTTMDSGQGGVNDNVFVMNDFSFAPTNGMEATFSRNQFIANRVEGSWHGLWGGYSYESRIIGNCFINNTEAIAIEHGQDNVVGSNTFIGNGVGIRLWADSIEPSDWGYPKHRETHSKNWQIVENRFIREKEPLRIKQTTAIDSSRNRVSDSTGARCNPASNVPTTTWWKLPAIPREPRSWPRTTVADRDRSAIIIDEWGPYDWRTPKLWPIDSVRSAPLRLRVLGPAGRWRVVSMRGVRMLSRPTGPVGDTVVVTPEPDSLGAWSLELSYTSPDNRTTIPFSYGRFEPRQSWTLRVFAWSDSTDPRTKPAAFDALLRDTPVLTRTAPRLDWMWYRPTITGVPQAHMALEATSRVTLPPGNFTLRTLSDDAIRVWVDGTLVIDHWTPHETMPDYAAISGGAHDIRAQYVQVDGWTELRLDLLRGSPKKSVGSAGPH
jgi:nitrous oxidase accessory protein NosD